MKKNTIYRTDAIEAAEMAIVNNESIHKALLALPSADVVSHEDYHNLLMATNDIDRALREYQAKEESESIEASNDDLIIKGAKGIQDGLYNIQNGELFQYKVNGGTVRAYPIVSAEAESKWTCTANFIVEQLERLKDMTDEERLKLLQMIFPSVEVVSREEYEKQERVIKGLQAVIDNYKADYERFINAQSAEAVQSWIPCSERLPEDGDSVIVTVIDDHGDTSWRYTDVAWLCEGTWIANNEILFGDVLAWMPLPTPYKGGTE